MPITQAYKALILDRDGTLNHTGPDDNGGYLLHEQLENDEIDLMPGARQGLEACHNAGIELYVFTQQNCVSKGLIDHDGVEAIHQHIQALLGPNAPITAFYYNTMPGAEDDWSKPGPGMLIALLKDYDLVAEEVLVVGDTVRDHETAIAAGLDYAYVASDKADKAAQSRRKAEATSTPFYDNLHALALDLARQL